VVNSPSDGWSIESEHGDSNSRKAEEDMLEGELYAETLLTLDEALLPCLITVFDFDAPLLSSPVAVAAPQRFGASTQVVASHVNHRSSAV
jgi:hypothetical protein